MPHEDSPHSYWPTLTIEVSEAVPLRHLICYKKELALRDPASLSANQVLPIALLCTSLHQTASCSETYQFSSFPYLSSFLKPQTFYKSSGSLHLWVMISFNTELWCERVEATVSIARVKVHTEHSHVRWWHGQINPFLSMHLETSMYTIYLVHVTSHCTNGHCILMENTLLWEVLSREHYAMRSAK